MGFLAGNISFHSLNTTYTLNGAPNGLRYLRWGGRRDAVRVEKAEAKKTPETAQTPQRQVHAVLGVFVIIKL